MTEERNFDRVARHWLELGPDQAPDRAIAAVLQAVETTSQVRSRPWRLSPWRLRPVNRTLSVAIVAVGILIVAGAAFLISRPGDPDRTPAVAASPSPAPTATALTASPAAASIPTASAASGNATAIAAGGRHTCALTRNGGVKCWGDNFYGELGNGSTTNSSAPVGVSGLTSGVSAIATGFGHSCALTVEGGVKCWGNNASGSLGDGTNTDSAQPLDVSGLTSGVTAIAAGGTQTCAVTIAGATVCWGGGGDGQLGDGSSRSVRTPVGVSGLSSGTTAIAAGDFHTCALTSTGAVKCWGSNTNGQLGDGSTSNRATPVDVSGLGGEITQIAVGNTHTCGLTSAGGVKCWGFNAGGQLGNDSVTDSGIPVDVDGLASGATKIAAGLIDSGELGRTAGRSHTCALMSAGGVKCWGGNYKGQLGDGTVINRTTPVDVSGLASGVTAISVGGAHTCALMNGGGVACWGSNSSGGQLGDGTTTDSSTPVVVKGL